VAGPYLWKDGAATVLPLGWGYAINSLRHVVGRTTTDPFKAGGDGVSFTIPQYFTEFNRGGRYYSQATRINESDQVVGEVFGSVGKLFFTSPGNEPTSLVAAFGVSRQSPGTADRNPSVAGLNSSGTVLVFDARDSRAYLWTDGRVTRVAPTDPAWRLDAVSGINDAGVIAGHAVRSTTGQRAAVILTPTP
jgi:hypothetical protein